MSRPRSRIDPELDRLLAKVLHGMDSGGARALEDVCSAHPGRAADLRRRVRLLAATSLVDLGPALDRLPPSVGDFELLERLGAGAMGVVHRARQSSTGREVALKLVRPELLVFADARARFRREVELTARLHHRSIVPVLAVGETGGLPWLALALVPGPSLAALIALVRERYRDVSRVDPAALPALVREATPQALRRVPEDGTSTREASSSSWSWRVWSLKAVLAIARALAHAHGKGILHRDVKPSNVLVGADGRVLLTDFGLARESGEDSLTRTRAAVGSLPYMAPEVLSGEEADARGDVYGLGALAFELLTLHRPFEGASSAALVTAILGGAPPSPRRYAPRLDPDEEAVLLRALERDPRRRYATAFEFAEDLEALLERRPTRARPLGPGSRLRRLVERRPAASTAAALAVLLVVGLPSALAWSQGRARARQREVIASLDQALERERDERLRADENLDRAVGAVDTLLTETSSVLLSDVPLMQELKHDLLERALSVLDELMPQDPSSPRRLLQAANVDLAAGLARLDLGNADAARSQLRAGLARLDGCADCAAIDAARTELLRTRLLLGLARAETRNDPPAAELAVRAALELSDRVGDLSGELLRERLLGRMALHDLTYGAGRKEEARAEIDAAADELELRGAVLSERDRLWLRARIQGMRGTKGYLDATDVGAAAEDLRAALRDLDAIAELYPEALAPRADALGFGVNLAAVELRRGNLDAAEAALIVARREGERLVGLFPRASKYRTDLAGLLVNLGLVYQWREDFAGCREAWEAAAVAGRAVATAAEPSPDALLQAGIALGNLASLERDEERFEAAIAAAAEGEVFLRRALALKPGHLLHARSLEFAVLTRGRSALELGRVDDARAALADAEAVAPKEALAQRALTDGWLHLARVVPEDERGSALAEALRTLVRAVELGWNDPDDLVRNEELDPLRALPGFPGSP